jgi:PHD/YefM family antitoxin component YafN of YafNO toxin-antitoxin module
METVTVSGARGRLYRLVDEVADSREPVLIAGKRANAVLVVEEDWRTIQETLFLLSVPGMRKSIREGMATPVSECVTELKW